MPKEADEMQHQIEQAQQRIAERKRKIGDDMGLAGIALQLQEEIDKNQKQLDADRLRIEQMLADSQKQFAEAAPKVEKLPEEQKAFVAELSAKVETVNTARMEYAKAVTARNDEADKTIADLESQRKTLAAQIDDHSRLVLEQRKSDYATAVAAKTKADAALQQANTALAEARGNDDQARVAQSLNTEKVTLASDVEVLKQQVNQQQQDVDEAIYLEPADSSVRVIQQNQKDKRPMYAGFTCAAIFLLFGALILRALSSRPAGLALTGLNLAPITTGRRAASSAAGNGAAAKPVEPNVPIQEHSAIA
jgi:DNA repair exonuclease SbcCD ATPase subunit